MYYDGNEIDKKFNQCIKGINPNYIIMIKDIKFVFKTSFELDQVYKETYQYQGVSFYAD